MEVVHGRCAGMDISKKDAKVCVRIAGAGRRKTIETVTTVVVRLTASVHGGARISVPAGQQIGAVFEAHHGA